MNLSIIILMAMILSFLGGLNFHAYAHSAGGGQDKIVDNYFIDFGFSEYPPMEHEPLLLSFELKNSTSKKPIPFTGLWTMILDSGDNLLFSGTIAQDIGSEASLTYVFPYKDSYIIRVEFQDNLKTIVETDFILEIAMNEDKRSSSTNVKKNFGNINNMEISVTDNGFEPDSIEIPIGTKVTWINKGSKLHWPASDFHPTHSKYPGSGIEKCDTNEGKKIFDACFGLKENEQYTFTFNEVGIWTVHDHLFPGLTMAVEVVDMKKINYKKNSNFLSNSLSFIKNGYNRVSGMITLWFSRKQPLSDLPSSEFFLKINYANQQKKIKEFSKKNPEETWKYLKRTFFVDGQVIGNPHELAHIIGNEIYRQYGLEGITSCDRTFGFGCYHGVTEKMLLELGRDSVPEVERQCIEIFPPSKTRNYTGCVHGMGHGLLTWEGLDVRSALQDCDMLSIEYRPFCYDGVFMEYSFTAPDAYLKNPWQHCDSLPSKYHFNCARYQGPLFMQNFGRNFTLSGKLCFNASSVKLRDTCIKSLGHYAAQRATGNLNKIEDICKLIEKDEGKYLCKIGASEDAIFQQYKNWWELSSKLCAQLPQKWKNRCIDSANAVKKQLSLSSPNEIKKTPKFGQRVIDSMAVKKIVSKDIEDLRSELKSGVGKCYRTNERNECLDQKAQSILQKNSFSDVLTQIEQMESEGLVTNCHDFMQFLARNEYTNNKNLPELLNQCTAVCFGACYHGAVEGYLNAPFHDYSGMDVTQVRKILMNACEPLKNDNRPGLIGQCVHGIGHGIMLFTDWNLNKSLKFCDLLPIVQEQQDCYGGAFMEFFPVSSKSDQSSTFLKPSDPHYPCTELDDKYLAQCYGFMIGQLIFSDKESLFENCETINPKFGPLCYNIIGSNSLALTSELNQLKNICDKAPAGKPRSLCITGVILSYADRYGGNPSKLYEMFDFCEIVDDEYKNPCYNKIGLTLQAWIGSPQERKNACGLIQNSIYQKLCQNPDNNQYLELFKINPVEQPIESIHVSDQNPIEALALSALNSCNDLNRPRTMNKETCYSKKFEDISFNNGANYAYKVLFELQKMDKDALGCHFIGHGIGYGAYKRNPEDWQKQINTINPACSYGSVHGTIELYVDDLPEGKFTKELLPTLCGPKPRADCNHIIGHLTLVETRGDIDKGLDMCSIFKDDRQRFFCLTGVFMEHQTALNLINHGLAPKSWLNWPARVDDLEIMCRSYKGENATACWKEISHAALMKFKHDPKKIFDFCNSAQVERGAWECKRHSLGIINAAKNYDIESLKNICTIKQPPNDPRFEGDCYINLVSSKLYTLPAQQVKDTIPFCASLKTEFRSSCFRQIGRALIAQSTSKNLIEEICSTAPTEFKTQCLFGTNRIT